MAATQVNEDNQLKMLQDRARERALARPSQPFSIIAPAPFTEIRPEHPGAAARASLTVLVDALPMISGLMTVDTVVAGMATSANAAAASSGAHPSVDALKEVCIWIRSGNGGNSSAFCLPASHDVTVFEIDQLAQGNYTIYAACRRPQASGAAMDDITVLTETEKAVPLAVVPLDAPHRSPLRPTYHWQPVASWHDVPSGMEIQMFMDERNGSVARIPEPWQLQLFVNGTVGKRSSSFLRRPVYRGETVGDLRAAIANHAAPGGGLAPACVGITNIVGNLGSATQVGEQQQLSAGSEPPPVPAGQDELLLEDPPVELFGRREQIKARVAWDVPDCFAARARAEKAEQEHEQAEAQARAERRAASEAREMKRAQERQERAAARAAEQQAQAQAQTQAQEESMGPEAAGSGDDSEVVDLGDDGEEEDE